MAKGFQEYFNPKNNQIVGVRGGTGEISYAKPVNYTPNLPLYNPTYISDTSQDKKMPVYNDPNPAGGVLGKGDSTGSGSSKTSSGKNAAPKTENPLLKEINNAFSGTMKYYDQAESTLRGQLPGIESDINSLVGESRSQLDLSKQATEAQLGNQEIEGGQRKEDAYSAAVRLYNELMRGGQQRFGGASSAGEAYQTLGANELQRNTAQIEQDYGNFMKEIEGARTNIQNQYTTAIQSLEAQKMRMVNEARRDFQTKLQEINRARGEAEDAKSNMRLQALQQLRNQVYQIELARSQEQQNLDAMLEQANNELASYSQQGMGAQQEFSNQTTTSPVTGIPIAEGGTTNEVAYTGVRDDENEMFGSILPKRRELAFA